MARLINIDGPIAELIHLQTGDLMVIGASGARVMYGHDVVEVLGPFYPGVLSATGDIIEPAGSPGTVMIVARRPGMATVETFWGDPWSNTKMINSTIKVSPG